MWDLEQMMELREWSEVESEIEVWVHVQLPMILESRVKDVLGFKDISKFKIKIFQSVIFYHEQISNL